MATRKRSASKSTSKGGGSTWYGLLAGVFIGLAVAAGVAFYITGAPVPFVDRASRDAPRRPPIDPKVAPDPNSALYARNDSGSSARNEPRNDPRNSGNGAAALSSGHAGNNAAHPATPSGTIPPADDLGALIATLDTTTANAALPAPPPTSGNASPTGSYFLQVGAYRVVEDAEALRARILMLGLPVTLQRAEVNGTLVNRVRVGPYNQLDDMNRARTRLGQERIVSTVVRQ